MIQYYEWLPMIETFDAVDSIENELALFTYSKVHPKLMEQTEWEAKLLNTPHKFDFFMVVNHFSGTCRFTIDMVEYNLTEAGNTIHLAPGQIFSLEEKSEDFDANIIVMSRRFIDSIMIYLNGSIPFRIDAKRNPIVHYSDVERPMIGILVNGLRKIITDKENPFRLQVTQHMMMAIFYSSERPRELREGGDVLRTNADVLSKQFMELVRENFRKERQLKFYSDAMCITPRYLSRVVKECTGSSAADWIERYVILEARALLKSTNMTIQQISDELNFPSQTFFGKYFKRRVGMSPKEYRRVG